MHGPSRTPNRLQRVEVAKAYMRHKGLPRLLRQRIQMFLDYSWTTQKGIDEQEVLTKLPTTLRQQVCVAGDMCSDWPLWHSDRGDLH